MVEVEISIEEYPRVDMHNTSEKILYSVLVDVGYINANNEYCSSPGRYVYGKGLWVLRKGSQDVVCIADSENVEWTYRSDPDSLSY